MVNVSLFCSAVRPKLWPALFKSLEGTSVEYEVVFAGNVFPLEYDKSMPFTNYKYNNKTNCILTENIKPAQCYEIARRHCTGEVVVWIADDCEFPNNVIGKAYEYWKQAQNDKLILSIQTKETGYQNIKGALFNMNIHRFFGGNPFTPLMAPLGMMSRQFLEDLGGLDHRYVCGQYENDIVMRAYTQGAIVQIFGSEDCFIDIDHLGKALLTGECTNDNDFRQRPFATGYPQDRAILEKSWVIYNEQNKPIGISRTQLDTFEPYAKDISLTQSDSNRGKWE